MENFSHICIEHMHQTHANNKAISETASTMLQLLIGVVVSAVLFTVIFNSFTPNKNSGLTTKVIENYSDYAGRK